MRPFFWGVDPNTNEDIPIYYDELESDLVQSFIKPVGGFIFPASLFIMSKLSSVPFYVQDWLPKRGKSMMYAPAKAGKSFLCVQLARCIGVGDSFLGLPTTKGKVMYVQWELGEEILQKRLKDTGKSYDNVWVGTTFSLKIDTPSGQKQLWKAMEAVEPNVLIIDPWYKAIIGDENESLDVRKSLDFLDTVIEAFNCSIFITHHAGKDVSKRGRGSSVLEDWVDSYLEMKKTSKPGEPLKVAIKPVFLRHAALPPSPITATLGQDFEFALTTPAPTVKEQVEAFVKKQEGEITPAQVFAKKIGSNTSVYQALDELVKEGKVIKVRRGVYQRRSG